MPKVSVFPKPFWHIGVALALVASACDKTRQPAQSECIKQKIEAFRAEPDAARIIRITGPDRVLYWFEDSLADGVEEVVDVECNVVCITDIEGISDPVPLCDGSIFDGQQEVVWQK